MAELKDFRSDACSDPESETEKANEKEKHIIDVEPNATISTTKLQKYEPKYLEEGEWLLHP